jgi:hypothetical protein
MPIEDNKRVVRTFFEEVWNRNAVSTLDEILSSENKHSFGADLGRVGPNEARAIIGLPLLREAEICEGTGNRKGQPTWPEWNAQPADLHLPSKDDPQEMEDRHH